MPPRESRSESTLTLTSRETNTGALAVQPGGAGAVLCVSPARSLSGPEQHQSEDGAGLKPTSAAHRAGA